MCKHFPRLKKYLSALITVFIICACCFIPSAAADGDTDVPPRLSDFSIKNSSSALPTETDDGIVTPSGTLKMTALENRTQKEFTDLYSADSYTVYGTYKAAQTSYYNYDFNAEEEKIVTGSGASKAMINGSESMTDFEASFTVTPYDPATSLYAGAAFRINASDFRTATFGTQGYILLLKSDSDSNNVQVVLRKYGTAADNDYDLETASGLLSDPSNGVTVKLKVEGDTAYVTVSDAQDSSNPQNFKFSLRPGDGQTKAAYFGNGAFALVSNVSHTFEKLSLSGKTAENYTEHEEAINNLTEQSSYTVYGNSGTEETNYGVTFSDGVISTAGQSKVKISGYSNIKDFHADFTVERKSGALMGGIGFHLQDSAFTAAPFGTPGYLLYANRASGSQDVKLYLRNYRTGSLKTDTLLDTFNGLLSDPTHGVHLEVTVSGSNLTVTVSDANDNNSSKKVENYPLQSDAANAGNYTGGSIAFVSNGDHNFSDISVSYTVSEPRYKTVENFEASADFTIPEAGTFDFGIMFNVHETVNSSPGLTGFVLKALRSKSTAENSVTLQLIRYGTDQSGNKNKNLGGLKGSTKTPNILKESNGAGEKIRLRLKVVQGNIYYSVMNLGTGNESNEFTSNINTESTASGITYNTAYSSGAVGCFSNKEGITISSFKLNPVCILDFGECENGSVSGGGAYSYGESVTLSATPDYGYYFGGWYNGDTLLSTQSDYTFYLTDEALTLTPKFIPYSFKYICSDTENRTVMIRLDNIDGVTEIGCKVTLKNENSEEVFTLSTAYVNAAAKDKKPWLADRDKVYYCDIDNDGTADTDDMASLQRGLLNGDSNTLTSVAADLTGNGVADIRDLVRFKKALSCTDPEFTEVTSTDFNYPFVIGNKLNESGMQYIKLEPYTVKDGKTEYSSARYFTYNGAKLESNSPSENHTPFGKIRIACVGDSITKGIGATGWENGDFSNAYPEQLGGLLGDSCTVGNFGRGSSYVYYEEGRTEYLWYPNTKEHTDSINFDPDIVIIKLGTNDAKKITSEDLSNEWAKQFTDIVNVYKNLDSKPDIYILSSITMVLFDSELREHNLKNYILPKQESVAGELGCTFLDSYNDLYDIFYSGDGFASDYLHPNDTGYKAIAEYVKNKISLDIFY